MSFFRELRHLPNMFGVVSLGRRVPDDASPELEAFLDEHDSGRGWANRGGDGRFGWGEVRATHELGVAFVKDLEQLPLEDRVWVEKGVSTAATMLSGFDGYRWKRFLGQ